MTLKRLLLAVLALCLTTGINAKSENEQAKEILGKAFMLLQNPTGTSLNYKLNVSLIHKSGFIIFKGRKLQRRSKRTIDWFDGQTFWTMNRSSKVVKIYNPKQTKDGDADITAQMEKVFDSCTYNLTSEQSAWRIKITSHDKKAKVRRAEVLVNKHTYAPMKLRVKYGILWVTIDLWNVRKGNYADSNFRFDAHKYPDAKIVDKRK